MGTWEEAGLRALAEIEAEARPELGRPPISLVVVDHFDFTMVDMGPAGARLLVRSLTRLEALMLVRERPTAVSVMTINERGQSLVERELGLDAGARPQVRFGTRMLVVSALRWNDIRWTLIEYECDGDGCVP